MATSGNRVGIVIPAVHCVCNQLARIVPQLEADDCLVVIWNGPYDAHVCTAKYEDSRLQWIEIEQYAGAGRARNEGAQVLSTSTILAFVDDDDIVDTNWLEQLVHPLENGLSQLAAGALVVKRGRDEAGAMVTPGQDYWHAQTVFGGNFAICASAWSLLDGFDLFFRYCEDTDLAWRAILSGLKISLVPDSIVEVTSRPIMAEFRQRFRWGYWSVVLLIRHNVPLNHLPSLATLVAHKRSLCYCRHPLAASIGQWLGQLCGLTVRPPVTPLHVQDRPRSGA